MLKLALPVPGLAPDAPKNWIFRKFWPGTEEDVNSETVCSTPLPRLLSTTLTIDGPPGGGRTSAFSGATVSGPEGWRTPPVDVQPAMMPATATSDIVFRKRMSRAAAIVFSDIHSQTGARRTFESTTTRPFT